MGDKNASEETLIVPVSVNSGLDLSRVGEMERSKGRAT